MEFLGNTSEYPLYADFQRLRFRARQPPAGHETALPRRRPVHAALAVKAARIV